MAVGSAIKALQGEEELKAPTLEEDQLDGRIDVRNPEITSILEGIGQAKFNPLTNEELQRMNAAADIRLQESVADSKLAVRDFNVSQLVDGAPIPASLAFIDSGKTVIDEDFVSELAVIQAALRSGETAEIFGVNFSDDIRILSDEVRSKGIAGALVESLGIDMTASLEDMLEVRDQLNQLGHSDEDIANFGAGTIDALEELVADDKLTAEAAILFATDRIGAAISQVEDEPTKAALSKYQAGLIVRFKVAEQNIFDRIFEFGELLLFPMTSGDLSDVKGLDIGTLLRDTNTISALLGSLEDEDLAAIMPGMFDLFTEANGGNTTQASIMFNTILNPEDTFTDDIAFDVADISLVAGPALRFAKSGLLLAQGATEALPTLLKNLGRPDLATSIFSKAGDTEAAAKGANMSNTQQFAGQVGLTGFDRTNGIGLTKVPQGVSEGADVLAKASDIGLVRYGINIAAETTSKRVRPNVVQPLQRELDLAGDGQVRFGARFEAEIPTLRDPLVDPARIGLPDAKAGKTAEGEQLPLPLSGGETGIKFSLSRAGMSVSERIPKPRGKKLVDDPKKLTTTATDDIAMLVDDLGEEITKISKAKDELITSSERVANKGIAGETKIFFGPNPVNLTNDVINVSKVPLQFSQFNDRLRRITRELDDISFIDRNLDAAKAKLVGLLSDDELFLKIAERYNLFDKHVRILETEIEGRKLVTTRRDTAIPEGKIVREIVDFDEGVSFVNMKVRTEDGFETTVRIPLDADTFTFDVGRLGTGGLVKTFLGSQIAQSTKRVGKTAEEIRAAQAIIDIVDQAISASRIRKRFRNKFDKALRIAVKGLSRTEKQGVRNALVDGDAAKRVYSDFDLKRDFGLNEAQIESYFNNRRIIDKMFDVQDAAAARELQFRGFVGLDMANSQVFRNARDVFIRPNDGNTLSSEVTRVYDAKAGKVVNVTEEMRRLIRDGELNVGTTNSRMSISAEVEARTASGGQAARNPELIQTVVFVERNTRGLPSSVLHRRIGYVPLLRDNVFWTVRRRRAVSVDGRAAKETVEETLGLFTLRTDATKSLSRIQDDILEAGGGKADDVIEVTPSREMSQITREDAELQSFGGLTDRGRTNRDVVFQGVRGDKERVNVKSALENAAGRASRLAATTEIKLQMREAYLQRFGNLLNNPRDINSGFKTGLGAAKTEEAAAALNQIKFMSGINTRSETLTAKVMTRFGIKLEEGNAFKSLTTEKFRRSAAGLSYNLATKEPSGFIRGVTFHGFLGLNPGQLITQSMGATIAFSLNPLRFPETLMQGLGLRMALAMRNNPAALEQFAKRLGGVGIDADDYLAMVRRFDSEGLFDSIFDTADFRALNSGAEISEGMLRRFANNTSGFFFREGELFNRGYGFIFAANEHARRVGKRVSTFTEGDWKVARTRWQAVSLRMDREAAAGFQQKAFTSVAGQFQQVTTKFYEIALGYDKTFSAGERMRIIMGQVALFGAVGLPFGEFLGEQILRGLGTTEWFDGLDADGKANAKALADQAIFGFMSQQIFGEQFDFTKFSIAKGAETFFTNMFENNFIETVAGPSGAFGIRAYENLGQFVTIMDANGADGEPLSADTLLAGVRLLAETNSGLKNLLNSGLFGDIAYATKDGRFLLDHETRNELFVEVAKALGVSVLQVRDTIRLGDSLKDRRDLLTVASKAAFAYWRHWALERGGIPSPNDPKNWDLFKAGLTQVALGLPANMQDDYWERLGSLVEGDKSVKQKTLERLEQEIRDAGGFLDDAALERAVTDEEIRGERIEEEEAEGFEATFKARREER